MARLARICIVALTSLAASACADDSPSSPSRRPADTLPPIAEGRYRLLVTGAGAAMGCEVTAPGVPFGGAPLPAAGYFAQDVLLREDAGAYAIRPEGSATGLTTLELRLDAAEWPSSPRVAGTLAGTSDQRAYDGPAIEATGTGSGAAAFDGLVVPATAGPSDVVLTGTASGRLTFSAAWTGQVVVCRSAQVVLQRP